MATGFHPFGGRVSRHFGDSLSPSAPYLSYYDIQLTREDVECIKDDWLTDNAIAFWEEYLEHETLNQYPMARINLLRPSMAFMLKATKDPSTLRSALPDFRKFTHVFLPINDNNNPNAAEGGSHWSLLVVSVVDRMAFHYDTLFGINDMEARIVRVKFQQLLGLDLHFQQINDCPQQENSRDCGVYVCLLMKLLLTERLLTVDSQKKVSMNVGTATINPSAGRKDMLKLIDGFRKEGRRRSSRSPSPAAGSSQKSPPRIGAENA